MGNTKQDEQEVAVICPSCKGLGTEIQVIEAVSDRKSKRIARGSTFVEVECQKCSGYGKVRIPITALKALKLEETEKP